MTWCRVRVLAAVTFGVACSTAVAQTLPASPAQLPSDTLWGTRPPGVIGLCAEGEAFLERIRRAAYAPHSRQPGNALTPQTAQQFDAESERLLEAGDLEARQWLKCVRKPYTAPAGSGPAQIADGMIARCQGNWAKVEAQYKALADLHQLGDQWKEMTDPFRKTIRDKLVSTISYYRSKAGH